MQAAERNNSDLNAKWKQAVGSLADNDLSSANLHIEELNSLKIKLGYSILPEYSRQLLEYSKEAMSSAEREKAAFLVRKSFELSPYDTFFLIQAANTATASREVNGKDMFLMILKSALKDRLFLADMALASVYPVLWAVTFAALIAAFCLFLLNMQALLVRIKSVLPFAKSKWLAAFLLNVFLITPLILGPLWTLIAYSALIYLLLPLHRLLAAASAVILILWAVAVPLKENSQIWMDNQTTRSILRISSGIYTTKDLQNLEQLSSERPFDAALLLANGKKLRRQAKYQDAEKIFLTAANIPESKQMAEAELAIVEFLKGNSQEADRKFVALEEAGFESPEFFFNFSKVRFDLLQTASSREFFEKAHNKDRVLTNELRSKEDLLGIKHPSSFAEYKIPFSLIIDSLTLPNTGAGEAAGVRFDSLIPGLNPLHLAWTGAILLVLFLFISPQVIRTRNLQTRFSETLEVVVSLIPAGSSFVCGKSFRGFIILSFLVFAALPLLAWPRELKSAFSHFAGLQLYYTFIYFFIAFAVSYIGYSAYKEDKRSCNRV